MTVRPRISTGSTLRPDEVAELRWSTFEHRVGLGLAAQSGGHAEAVAEAVARAGDGGRIREQAPLCASSAPLRASWSSVGHDASGRKPFGTLGLAERRELDWARRVKSAPTRTANP